MMPFKRSPSKNQNDPVLEDDTFLSRIRTNWVPLLRIDVEILLQDWKLLTLCVITHLVHNFFTNLAYVLHTPAETPLWDLGFLLLPQMTKVGRELAETLTGILFSLAVVIIFSPYFIVLMSQTEHADADREKSSPLRTLPTFSSIIFTRGFITSALCVVLRIGSFIVTSLPAPAPHCRASSPTYNPPSTAAEIFTRWDTTKGCGDLVFSGHTTYAMCAFLVVWFYLPVFSPHPLPRMVARIIIGICVVMVIFVILSIISARNHYTVDVWVAMYTTSLVWFVLWKYRPDKTVDLDQILNARTVSSPSGSANCCCMATSKEKSQESHRMSMEIEMTLDADDSVSGQFLDEGGH